MFLMHMQSIFCSQSAAAAASTASSGNFFSNTRETMGTVKDVALTAAVCAGCYVVYDKFFGKDKHGEQLTAVQTTQKEHTERFDKVDDTLKQQNKSLKKIQATQVEHSANWGRMFSWSRAQDRILATQNTLLTAANDGIGWLKERLTTVESQVVEINRDLKATKETVEQTQKDVTKLTATTAAMQTTLNQTHADVKALTEQQKFDSDAQKKRAEEIAAANKEEHDRTRSELASLKADMNRGLETIQTGQQRTTQSISSLTTNVQATHAAVVTISPALLNKATQLAAPVSNNRSSQNLLNAQY